MAGKFAVFGGKSAESRANGRKIRRRPARQCSCASPAPRSGAGCLPGLRLDYASTTSSHDGAAAAAPTRVPQLPLPAQDVQDSPNGKEESLEPGDKVAARETPVQGISDPGHAISG